MKPIFLLLLMAQMTFCMRQVSAQDVPYPSSRFISGVTFAWATRARLAPGSDNWAVTWADDGHQYAAWGDGGGFGGTNRDGRVSLGIARIEGGRENCRGFNVFGGKDAEHPAQFGGKSYGIISIEGAMYLWCGPGSGTKSYEETRIYRSTNHAATWSKAPWAFTKTDGLAMPTFCQFGKDYSDARDDYVYSYFVRLQGNPKTLDVHKPGRIDLVRVPKNQMMVRTRYEFFAGLSPKGSPSWTRNLKERVPVFQDPRGVGWCLSVSFNPSLGRYFLCTEHDASFRGNLGLFDAPEPWGPWTTVLYENDWGHIGSTFFWNFSNKWLSKDGREFVMIFTGSDRNVSWNSVRGRFHVH